LFRDICPPLLLRFRCTPLKLIKLTIVMGRSARSISPLLWIQFKRNQMRISGHYKYDPILCLPPRSCIYPPGNFKNEPTSSKPTTTNQSIPIRRLGGEFYTKYVQGLSCLIFPDKGETDWRRTFLDISRRMAAEASIPTLVSTR
jgi:hypothetical protein